MPDATRPAAIRAADTPPRARVSGYPPEFLARVAGRDKRPLGDGFGLATFGVNLTRLAPGAWSSLHHRHGRQDEFIYVLEGTPTLLTDAGETLLSPGMCAGFPAGGTALCNTLTRLSVGLPDGEPLGSVGVGIRVCDFQVHPLVAGSSGSLR